MITVIKPEDPDRRKGDRFERRRERTRRELLEAAKRVIASRGYHDTKVQDIASEADLGVGTFYLHFKTKEDMVVELIDEAMKILRDELRKGVQTGLSPLERVEKEWRVLFENSPTGTASFTASPSVTALPTTGGSLERTRSSSVTCR